jgi:flagellar motor switch protein FliN/FliY
MNDDDLPKLDLDDLSGKSPPGAQDLELAAPEPEPPVGLSRGPVEELGAVYDVPVQLSAVLGKATMPVSQLLRLGRGAVLELDRKVGESIDILVNNRLVARGEVVIVDDRIGVTMTEIIRSEG